jgi:homopolymeric O-antigen transport system ATP-binding protein
VAEPRVSFDGVWKKFHRGERHTSLRDLVPAAARRLFGRARRAEVTGDEFWAIEGVSFDVHPGQALGIIGPNGAGKSTTLKLLTRILRPTRGRCRVRGRVGALIEVAAGFHPDLTGRENVFLQGAIMGMRRAEIARKFTDIIEFAGVAEFVDTPVKHFSSGMGARLGFSIAAHLDPDVLVIDEVLAVGDMAFQERCFARMREFKTRGIAIVLVSHNLQAVAGLCDEVVLLAREVRFKGPAAPAIEQYVRMTDGNRSPAAASDLEVVRSELRRPEARSDQARPGEAMTLRVALRARRPVTGVHFGLQVVRSTDAVVAYYANVYPAELGVTSFEPGEELMIDFSFRANLTRGAYHIELTAFHNDTRAFLFELRPAAIFSVVEQRTVAGIADLELTSTTVAVTSMR